MDIYDAEAAPALRDRKTPKKLYPRPVQPQRAGTRAAESARYQSINFQGRSGGDKFPEFQFMRTGRPPGPGISRQQANGGTGSRSDDEKRMIAASRYRVYCRRKNLRVCGAPY